MINTLEKKFQKPQTQPPSTSLSRQQGPRTRQAAHACWCWKQHQQPRPCGGAPLSAPRPLFRQCCQDGSRSRTDSAAGETRQQALHHGGIFTWPWPTPSSSPFGSSATALPSPLQLSLSPWHFAHKKKSPLQTHFCSCVALGPMMIMPVLCCIRREASSAASIPASPRGQPLSSCPTFFLFCTSSSHHSIFPSLSCPSRTSRLPAALAGHPSLFCPFSRPAASCLPILCMSVSLSVSVFVCVCVCVCVCISMQLIRRGCWDGIEIDG